MSFNIWMYVVSWLVVIAVVEAGFLHRKLRAASGAVLGFAAANGVYEVLIYIWGL